MTRDEIIKMAREADLIDFRDAEDDPHTAQMVEFLQRFATLVAAAEREACAKVCEERAAYYDQGDDDGPESRRGRSAKSCAAAIRTRSTQ